MFSVMYSAVKGAPIGRCGLRRPADRWSLAFRGRTVIRDAPVVPVGGDEESRTPDLLLAKQALYQLSYVPSDDGGRFWTRTRDLCLIRAVL